MADRADEWFGLPRRAKPLVVAGVTLGIGLGGFVDGILLHQVLQWHHMLSSYPNPAVANDLRLNVLADGLFHVATYAFTVAGVVLLFRVWRRRDVVPTARSLFGSTLMGWGVFNLVEGVVDHNLLGIHHVWPAGPGGVLLWDLAYLLAGALLLVGGYAIVRSDDAVATASPETPPARG